MQTAPYDGWVKTDVPLELSFPRNAINVILTPSDTADTYGSYVQLVASTTGEFLPQTLQASMVVFGASGLFGTDFPMFVEITIGVGASPNEVEYCRLIYACKVNNLFDGFGGGMIINAHSFPISPTPIPNGSRIAAKIRTSQTLGAGVINFYAGVYLEGYDGKVPLMQSPYSFRAHQAGIHKAQNLNLPSGTETSVSVPNTANWSTWTAYTETIASTAGDLIIRWIAVSQGLQNVQIGFHMQIATGTAGNEVPRAQIAIPGGGTTTSDLYVGGVFKLTTPLLVKKGTRVTVRVLGDPTSATTVSWSLGYQEI